MLIYKKKVGAKKADKKDTKKEVTAKDKSLKDFFTSKNIIIIITIFICLIIIGIFIFNIQKNKETNELTKSYLLESGAVSLEIKNLDEVNQILTEAPTEYFILITYLNDEKNNELETGLKPIIDKYKLNDSFYYLNIDNIKDEDNYLTRLNNTFNTDKIKKVPIILYYRDGKIVDTVSRYDDNTINASDFQKLLDIYEIDQ